MDYTCPLFNFPMLQECPNQANNPVHNSTQSDSQSIHDHENAKQSNFAAVEAPTHVVLSKHRALQHVLTQPERLQIVDFMIKDARENRQRGLFTRAIRQFPAFFHGKQNANFNRAKRYWSQRKDIISKQRGNGRKVNGIYYFTTTSSGIKIRISKASNGRGRKPTVWNSALHQSLLVEFNRLRKAGVMFNKRLLQVLALRLISKSTSDAFAPIVRDEKSGKLISDHITMRWVEHFIQKNNIESRSQCGKLSVSPAKRKLIHREIAYHLGQLSRDFASGTPDDDCVFNSDETHFVIDLHNHKTLAMKGEKEVKYADIVSGDEGMTMMVTIISGIKACLYPAFLIFQNDNRSYPIRGLKDDIPGVPYPSGPKGWIDSITFVQWLREHRALGPLPNGKKRILLMDNCSGHNVTDEAKEALRAINTELRFLPKNATDLCQPADSSIIQKLKTAWRRRWEEKKINMIEKGMWTNPREGSGKLTNPGKEFFLRLAADVVRDINCQRDKHKGLYSRKSMIRCGLNKNLNGVWEVDQLFPELQLIVKKYPEHFDGKPVSADIDLDAERTESDED